MPLAQTPDPYLVRSRRVDGGSQIVSDVIRRADNVTIKTLSHTQAVKLAEALNLLAKAR